MESKQCSINLVLPCVASELLLDVLAAANKLLCCDLACLASMCSSHMNASRQLCDAFAAAGLSRMMYRPCHASRSADGILVHPTSQHIQHVWLAYGDQRGRNLQFSTPRAMAVSARSFVTMQITCEFTVPGVQQPALQNAFCHLISPATERVCRLTATTLALERRCGGEPLSH
eukprot:TRINITY_DN87662_c0_g1_i1.p1 TRINITY_DN87662_c0_g1~~TRINITY_DN87662_c0_g1_i1.p1  ORF type:complete len:173 (-),score=28.61 TRINITY_DN87662_c0_g1_i1:50-568(-)